MSDIVGPLYDEQFRFYDHDAGRNRLLYVVLKMVVIASAAAIPVVSLAANSRLPAALLGALIAVAEGYIGLTKLHERWIAYRKAAEELRTEKLMFDTRSGPYSDGTHAAQLFGDRLVAIVRQERGEWETLFAQPEAKTEK